MKIETKHNIGEMVTLRHDKDKLPRQITGVSIRGESGNLHSYNLQNGTNADTWHYEFEIEQLPAEKDKPGFLKNG